MLDQILVLLLEDTGMRSLLIGRLSIEGETLVTFTGAIDDPALARAGRPPAILITDLEMEQARITALSGDRWDGLIVIGDDADAHRSDTVAVVRRSEAVNDIRATLAGWRAEALPPSDQA